MSRLFRTKAPKVDVDLYHPQDDHHAECVVEFPKEFADFYVVSGVWREGPLTGQPVSNDDLDLLTASNCNRLAEAYAECHQRQEGCWL